MIEPHPQELVDPDAIKMTEASALGAGGVGDREPSRE